jgi:hypothetical protein
MAKAGQHDRHLPPAANSGGSTRRVWHRGGRQAFPFGPAATLRRTRRRPGTMGSRAPRGAGQPITRFGSWLMCRPPPANGS